MSKKAEEQDLAERERIEREKAAEEAKKHRASKGDKPATETEHPPSDKLEEQRASGELFTHPEKGPYHGYTRQQIERMEAERNPPDPVPTEESAAVPPNPEPEPPPPEPEQPPPEPPARGRAA